MYRLLLAVFLYCSALTAADDADVVLEVPKTLDGVPAYCVQFLKHIVRQPLESDLLSLVDDWEDNMSLFGWDDGQVTDVLLKAAHSASDSDARDKLFAIDQRDLSALYDVAIKDLKAGWETVSVAECPIAFKKPDELCLFAKEAEGNVVKDEFLRFLISRLGMQGEANCRSLCSDNRCNLVRNKKSYLWVKKESLERFQELFNFDLGDGELG